MTEPSFGEAVELGARQGRKVARGCLLIGIPTLFVVSCLGGLAVYAYLALIADATIYVHHAAGRAEVRVDEEVRATPASPGVVSFEMPRGVHELSVRNGEDVMRWSVDVTGFDHLLVSTDPGACFSELNVGRALYGDRTLRARGNRCDFAAGDLEVLWTCTAPPCEIGNAHASLADLPDSIEAGHTVGLMVPVDCAEAATFDPYSALGRMLGCAP